jgi:biotin carboxyl carrier protein
MGQAYSAGLTVTDSIILKKERILPLKGKVLVKKGDKVKAEDVVAETLLPGKVVPFNLANKLGVTPAQLVNFIKIEVGQQITKDTILAETKGLFGTGLFKNEVRSPVEGEVENISSVTGQILLREPRVPVQVKAFIDGIVTDVIEDEGVIIENKSAYIQGIFGIGGETIGEIKVMVKSPADQINPQQIDQTCQGKIIVSGSFITYDAIEAARKNGVKAIITGGIDDQDIKKLLGHDIGVAITGHENIGLTIVCTEGFGKIDMAKKTFELLKKFDGHKTSIHGKTQIRAGVIRPEIIIPLDFDEKELVSKEATMPVLEPGTLIRVIRQPNFGKIAKVISLPEELTKVESETLVRVLEAQFEDGTKMIIPRANVEVIET